MTLRYTGKVKWSYMKKIILALLFIALVAASVSLYRRDHAAESQKASTYTTAQSVKGTAPVSGFNKSAHPIDEASSIWAVVNKGRALPQSYAPDNLVTPQVRLSSAASSENMHLRSEAASAMQNLIERANSEGVNLMLVSGYRSYATQVSTYNSYVASDGQAAADTYSARPGHSEHQTGLAADLGAVSGSCQLDACFGDTAEGKWLAANSYKFGFIVRYGKGNDKLTGYQYEPWHVRYVGKELAEQIQSSGQTLEQFFGLPSYSDYPASSFELHSD
jgi:D-alanyl-D-alanine carboxypeptidase